MKNSSFFTQGAWFSRKELVLAKPDFWEKERLQWENMFAARSQNRDPQATSSFTPVRRNISHAAPPEYFNKPISCQLENRPSIPGAAGQFHQLQIDCAEIGGKHFDFFGFIRSQGRAGDGGGADFKTLRVAYCELGLGSDDL